MQFTVTWQRLIPDMWMEREENMSLGMGRVVTGPARQREDSAIRLHFVAQIEVGFT